MNKLITLSILLLAVPSLASAQAAQTFDVTSGSMTHSFLGDYPYTIAGPGFSSSGDIVPLSSPLDLPVGPGTGTFIIEGISGNDDLADVSLTVHGVPWSFPLDTIDGAGASALFETTVTFGAKPGIYHSTFTFIGDYVGGPASVVAANPDQCVPSPNNCMRLNFFGSGIVTWDLIPNPNIPGTLAISQATFTFKAPEPSTWSLLLTALAGSWFWGAVVCLARLDPRGIDTSLQRMWQLRGRGCGLSLRIPESPLKLLDSPSGSAVRLACVTSAPRSYYCG